MTKDDIIRMAKEAGQADGTTPLERSIVIYAAKSSLFLEKFAALVATAEREAVLDLVDAYAKNNTDLADAIRARGKA